MPCTQYNLPDYDRDGLVGTNDVARYLSGRPVYFWANEDKCRGDDAFGTFAMRNAANLAIDGRNDLVNFLTIAVDVGRLAERWGVGGVRYELCSDGGSMAKAMASFADVPWSRIGDAHLGDALDVGGTPLHRARLEKVGRSKELPEAFVELSRSGRSTVLVEFPETTRYDSLHLRALLRETGEELFSAPLRIHVGDVDGMIGWENLRAAAGGSDGIPTRLSTPDWPEEDHEPGSFVFVHGYNVAEDSEFPFWARNVFKKMWWAGLDRGFVAVQWLGNEGQIYVPTYGWVTPNFFGNAYNAYRTAPALKDAMDGMPGPKWFLAHSLGNLLVCAAIQDFKMPHERFFMLNAAVAMESLDPEQGTTQESHDNMTPQAWAGYADRVRPTHWFERFPEGDGRRLLTPKGRFRDVTNIVNFYSTQDEVVANGDGQPKPVSRNFAWYLQETRKGEWTFMLHANEGGWAFNPFYDTVEGCWVGNEYSEIRRRMSPQDAAELSNEELRQHPFFQDFRNPEMHTSPNGAIVATNYLYRAEMLAYAIPAESYAVGANPLPWLNAYTNAVTNESIPSRNFNMATFIDGQEDLPVNGSNPEKKYRDWQHSTFVQRSYKRVHRLYKEIIKHMKEIDHE